VDIVHAAFGREPEGLVAAVILKKLTARQNNSLVVCFCSLDLSIEKIGERDSRALRRDWGHFVDRKQVITEVIQSFPVRTRPQRNETQCSSSQGGEVEFGRRFEIRIEQGKHIAAVHRLHVYGYSVVTVSFDPNLVMRRFAFLVLLAVVDFANQYPISALCSWGLCSFVAHVIFSTPCWRVPHVKWMISFLSSGSNCFVQFNSAWQDSEIQPVRPGKFYQRAERKFRTFITPYRGS
jgi:hypothetical protein